MYEAHRNAPTEEERLAIYQQIDQLSNQASSYVAANEYDRLLSAIGAKRTNAYTWVDQTVYVNDIPSNELERWMKLESERFNKLVLRLFHTELETVYEEFNISQDKDFRKVSKALNAALFPSHPYGTQTTLGEGEHLKSPSQHNIQRFFQTYYVPNNMAIILSGTFNPDEAVALAERYFGNYQPKTIPTTNFPPQPPLQKHHKTSVLGQESEYLEIGWRFPGANWEHMAKLDILKGVLYNKKAGLIDQNLTRGQKLLAAAARLVKLEDYATFRLYGKPRQGQSLEAVEQLLLDQIEAIKSGDFSDWLMEAVVNEYRLSEYQNAESNDSRVHLMTTSFILGVQWDVIVKWIKSLEQITKQELIDFVNQHFKDNYVVVYKKNGADPNIMKVEKPPITPVKLNREEHSAFGQKFLQQKSPPLKAQFLDYKRAIHKSQISETSFSYIRNKTTPLFSMDYLFEIGRNHNKLLPLALGYLPFLGSHKVSAQNLQQEFFRLGLNPSQSVNNKRAYINLSGLESSFPAGLTLIENWLHDLKPDAEALEKYTDGILSRRANFMKDKQMILRKAMYSYAKYGADNPFTNIFSAAELKSIQPDTLIDQIRQLLKNPHNIFYYGQNEPNAVVELLKQKHQITVPGLAIPEAKQFIPVDQTTPEVLLVDFPMVQVELMLLSKGTTSFNLHEYIYSNWYNNYFGYGLSSVVFQEIREAKALAYSTYANYISPNDQKEPHFLQAFVGTQPDKLRVAINTLLDILENMPVHEKQIEQARQSTLRKIESSRILKSNIYWNYRLNKRRGFDRDIRQDLYETLLQAKPQDLIDFQNQFVKNRNYTLLVIGNKKNLDMDFLKSYGSVKELSIQEVFGYR